MSNPEFALAESVSTTNASLFIAIYILVLIYCCFGLAIVCDVYFVPALQKLSYTYDLPPDIAGSTLMALGASVPELFASLIGVFVTEDDIGTGSIIGSSCFNLIAVPAACAFVAAASFSHKLTISPAPVIRNSAFYAITILVLLLIIKDNKVDIPEAVILLLFFVMYMAFMIFCAQTTKGNNKKAKDNINHQSITASASSSSSSEYQQLKSPYGSLTGSYISSDDSAIGGDCNNKYSQQRQQQQQQPAPHHVVYGQYHLATNAGQASLNKNQPTESTPLFGSTSKNCEINLPTAFISQNNNNNNENDNFKVNDIDLIHRQPLVESLDVSIDLGFAVKNSACLVKSTASDRNDYHHIKYYVDQNNNNYNSNDNHHGLITGAVNYDNNNINNDKLKQHPNHDDHDDNWLNSMWILVPMLPLTLSLKVLTPLKFKNTCWTIWTFLVSIALIGALTYVSVWMVHLFGQTLGIPETVAGMTILSWGTGIPELIASIVLIKKTAQADMAICNTIGSNVIDVSFCLSLPWIVKCMLNRAEGLKPEVEIQSAALPWTSFLLLLSLVLLILILRLHNWELSCSVGIWLMLTYFTFVGVATYLESSYASKGLDLFDLI